MSEEEEASTQEPGLFVVIKPWLQRVFLHLSENYLAYLCASLIWRFHPSLFLWYSLLLYFSTSLCTSSKIRAFFKTQSPVHAGSLCKWLPRMNLYYFTKEHQRRNLFCSTRDMISSPFYFFSSIFWAIPWEKDKEEGIHHTQLSQLQPCLNKKRRYLRFIQPWNKNNPWNTKVKVRCIQIQKAAHHRCLRQPQFSTGQCLF